MIVECGRPKTFFCMKGNSTLFALPNIFTPFAPAVAHNTPFRHFVFFSVEGMCCVKQCFIILQLLCLDCSTALFRKITTLIITASLSRRHDTY
jgi:hypothetical protein